MLILAIRIMMCIYYTLRHEMLKTVDYLYDL